MTELSSYVNETLWEDEEFVLSRRVSDRAPSPHLALKPAAAQPTPETLTRLEHAYAMRDELDPASAARRVELEHHWKTPASIGTCSRKTASVSGRKMSCGRARLILAEAQRLSHTGSFGWHVSSGELFWSDQTCRIIGVDEGIEPTLDLVFQRIYPEDIARVQEIFDRGVQAGTDPDFEQRFLIPDGSVNHVHVVAHALRNEREL